MYLSIGNDMAVRESSIIGIFDMDNTSTSKRTRDFLSRAEKEGSVFVIRPSEKPNIGRLEKNRKKLEKLYELGYKDGERVNEALFKFLEK